MRYSIDFTKDTSKEADQTLFNIAGMFGSARMNNRRVRLQYKVTRDFVSSLQNSVESVRSLL
jgi:hypothetical protein